MNRIACTTYRKLLFSKEGRIFLSIFIWREEKYVYNNYTTERWERTDRDELADLPDSEYWLSSRISDGCPGNAASRRARNLEWNAGAAWASTSASAPTDKAPSTFVAARRSWKVSRSSWWAVVKHRWTATGRRAAQPAQSTSPGGGIVGECRCPPRQEPPGTRSSWSSRWRGKLDSRGEWKSISHCFVLMVYRAGNRPIFPRERNFLFRIFLFFLFFFLKEEEDARCRIFPKIEEIDVKNNK